MDITQTKGAPMQTKVEFEGVVGGPSVEVGQPTKVIFNGHLYDGVVLEISKARVKIRFTTGSGRTRETWFNTNKHLTMLRTRGLAPEGEPAERPDASIPLLPLILDQRRREEARRNRHPFSTKG
jgi:hypothetical protein